VSTATATSPVLTRRRLDLTGPKSVVVTREGEVTIWTAFYRTRAHAHASAKAFNCGHMDICGRPERACEVWPLPDLCIRLVHDERPPRHRLPGRPKSGPVNRTVLSGRHVDREREVA
jgi:hypothetical protein